jgi:HSP90 family molecular chaperone
MLSDKITIKSKTDESKPIFVEISNVSDYIFVDEWSKPIPTGTVVELNLRGQPITDSNIRQFVRHFARHVEFLIEVNGENLHSTPYKLVKEYMSANKVDLPYYLHSININHESVVGEIALIGKCEKGKFVPIHNNMILDDNKFFLSNNGILIQDKIDKSFKS